MPFKLTCPNPSCGSILSVPGELGKKAIRCPKCGQVIGGDAVATLMLDTDATPQSPARTLDLPTDPAGESLPFAEETKPLPPKSVDRSTRGSSPERIGRFVVRRFLGEGAFGRVYEAYDSQLDRSVALKVAKPELLQSEKRIKRFLREAKSAANLRHPNIVPVFDSGSDGGHFYIASAFIAGQSLDKHLDELPKGKYLDFRMSVQIVRRLAEALAYAHQHKVVHRDVKPANVMLDEMGEPLLMDFGLAAREEGGEKLTQEGVKGMGTPAYMAPEQGAGEAVAASDQYSLGCTLFELLTGLTPFSGSPELQMFLHQSKDPPSLRKLNRRVPLDLETICLKALSKKPSERYADCQALADDLRRWLDGDAITARRLGLRERVVRWCKKEPKLALTAAVAAAALIGV
ncbi:MAG: protein kinase, partial [Planctomycetes bacterium]|nr:protein kinase [Planctomycetota bacterium]